MRQLLRHSNGAAHQSLPITTNEASKTSLPLMGAVKIQERYRPQPQIEAYPREGLFDVPTQVVATGLQPGASITFKLTTYDNKGIKVRFLVIGEFTSLGHYESDANGQVDLRRATSLGGSYTGVFPSGLLSTLEPPAGKHAYKRLTVTDTSKPTTYVLSMHEGLLGKDEDSPAMHEVQLERHFRGPGVKRIEVHHGAVRGALYVPATPGPHPAVIDMFGASASFMEHRSALLASRGILSLALPYFGYKDLPKTLERMDLEYFEEAVDYLLSSPTAVQNQCGVVATCQGGSTAIAMGVWIEKVKAVFAINASACLYETVLYKGGQPLLSGYKLCSEDLDFDEHFRGRLNPERVAHSLLNVDSDIIIPIEKASSDTKFFLAAAEHCSLQAPVSMRNLAHRLQRAGKNNFYTKIYPKAGHIIEPPYGPHIYQNYQQYFPYKSSSHTVPKVGTYLSWGGEARSHCHAQEQAWLDLQHFITTHIRPHDDRALCNPEHNRVTLLASDTKRPTMAARASAVTVWLMVTGVLVSTIAVPQGYNSSRGRQLQQGTTEQQPMNYNFAWKVDDAEYQNYYGHQEAGNNGRVEGSYYVWLPDQRLMRVDYYVDGDSGFVPTITYQDAYGPMWEQRPSRQ
ncbi:Acyl-CoA thioester hydrolase/bile acid-CoA amino acid N-acetyltransferase [Trinorchestia longiramus]|nr:Acyl-CoA thioester hydrolase/bile acid-CoA amino acid N-acetyltransferase [Trinorchestia longiramus]